MTEEIMRLREQAEQKREQQLKKTREQLAKNTRSMAKSFREQEKTAREPSAEQVEEKDLSAQDKRGGEKKTSHYDGRNDAENRGDNNVPKTENTKAGITRDDSYDFQKKEEAHIKDSMADVREENRQHDTPKEQEWTKEWHDPKPESKEADFTDKGMHDKADRVSVDEMKMPEKGADAMETVKEDGFSDVRKSLKKDLNDIRKGKDPMDMEKDPASGRYSAEKHKGLNKDSKKARGEFGRTVENANREMHSVGKMAAQSKVNIVQKAEKGGQADIQAGNNATRAAGNAGKAAEKAAKKASKAAANMAKGVAKGALKATMAVNPITLIVQGVVSTVTVLSKGKEMMSQTQQR